MVFTVVFRLFFSLIFTLISIIHVFHILEAAVALLFYFPHVKPQVLDLRSLLLYSSENTGIYTIRVISLLAILLLPQKSLVSFIYIFVSFKVP